MNRSLGFVLAAAVLAVAGCRSTAPKMRHVEVQSFGTTRGGTPVRLFTLRSLDGPIARITDYGATLVELWLPDRGGDLEDVVLGFDDVSGYESDANQYFGCTTGRVCNRIAEGRFQLGGKTYQLAVNNGPNHLHGGGERALSRVVWEATPESTPQGPAVRFTYTSPDGEEGYPGTLDIAVTYTLTHDGELRIDYEATTDAPTPVNLTNHAYWNLSGHGSLTVLDHILTIAASHYTPTDATLIPTGEIAPVEGTPLDFRRPKPIRADIDELIDTAALGYDHNFVLDSPGGALVRAAELYDPASGRSVEILTTEPGLQFYSGNFLEGQTGKQGRRYAQRSAVCLETQHFPDSVNQPSFPSIVLRPGETFRSTTVHRFRTR